MRKVEGRIMGKIINLEEKFREYIDGSEGYHLRSERLVDEVISSVLHTSDSNKIQVIRNWMRSAYLQGCRDMSNDCIDALGDFGTAVAGCVGKTYTIEESFDLARDNLARYVSDVFTNKE